MEVMTIQIMGVEREKVGMKKAYKHLNFWKSVNGEAYDNGNVMEQPE